jgi:hypothetical protein
LSLSKRLFELWRTRQITKIGGGFGTAVLGVKYFLAFGALALWDFSKRSSFLSSTSRLLLWVDFLAFEKATDRLRRQACTAA